MAHLFHYNPDNITNASQFPAGWASIFGSPTFGTGDGPEGINTIHTDGALSGVFLPNIAIPINAQGLVVGAGFNIASFAGTPGYTQLMAIGSSTLTQAFILGLASDGSLNIWISPLFGGPSVIAASPSGTFTFGNRHEVELLISSFASTGAVTVYLDGVAVAGLTGITVSFLGSLPDGGTIHSVLVGGCNTAVPGDVAPIPSSILLDSTYALDTTGSHNNAPYGPCICAQQVPTGAGHVSAWTPNGAGAGWQCISEIPPDGDTTYISDATVNDQESCVLGAPTPSIVKVYAVAVIADQRQDTPGGGRTVSLGLGNGSGQQYSSIFGVWGLGTTYKMNTTPFGQNPFTSAPWALADLTGLEVAAKVTT